MSYNKVYFEKITLEPKEERAYANAYVAVWNILISRKERPERPSHEQVRDYAAALLEFGFIPENQEELEDYLLDLHTKDPEKFRKFVDTAFKIDYASYKLAGGVRKTQDIPEKLEISLPYEKPAKRIPKWLAYLALGAIAASTAGAIAYVKTGHENKHDKEINELRENAEKIPVIGPIATSYFQLIGLGDKDNDGIVDINDKWPEIHNFPAQKYAREKGLSEEIIEKYIWKLDTSPIPPRLTDNQKALIDFIANQPKDKQEEITKKLFEGIVKKYEDRKYNIRFWWLGQSADIDRDGLGDVAELRLGLSPLDKDTDHDCIWDFIELLVYPRYLDPKNPSDAEEFMKKIPNVYADDPYKNLEKLKKELELDVVHGNFSHDNLIKIAENDPVVRYYAKKIEFKEWEEPKKGPKGAFPEYTGKPWYIVLVDGKEIMNRTTSPSLDDAYSTDWPSYYLTTKNRVGSCRDVEEVAGVLLDLNGYPVKMVSIPGHGWTEFRFPNGELYAIDAGHGGLAVPMDVINTSYKKRGIKVFTGWQNDKVDW